MTKLAWNIDGKRYFEAGVDRGVLYVEGIPGVPWTGLVSVTQSPTGGEAQPYYLDGIKYLNVATAEEFAATINAFSSPREFAVCDGTVSVANGLFATQQPRKPFAFCYRTRVGNDLQGVDHAYKLHVVYNALAAPSERAFETLNADSEPGTLSWEVTTTPPRFGGFRPTAHFEIDSRFTPVNLMSYIEDLLYGSDNNDPGLVTAQELTDLFTSKGPVIYRNLVKSPIGPSTTNLSGMRISGSELMDLISDAGIPTMEIHDDIGRGSLYVDPNMNFSDAAWEGKWIAMAADIQPMDYFSMMHTRLRITPYSSVYLADEDPNTAALTQGEYKRVSVASRITVMPETGYIRALVWPEVAGNQVVDTNFLDDATWWEYAATVQRQGAGTGMDGTTEGSVLISGSSTQDGLYAMGDNTEACIMKYGVPAIPGQKVILSAWVRGAVQIPVGGASVYCRIYDSAVSPMSRWSFAVSNTVAIAANVWTQIVGTVTVPDDCQAPMLIFGLYKQPIMTSSIRWSTPSMVPQQRLRIRNYSVSVGDTREEALAAVAEPLSGDMQPVGSAVYEWEGTPNNSSSVLKSWGELPN